MRGDCERVQGKGPVDEDECGLEGLSRATLFAAPGEELCSGMS